MSITIYHNPDCSTSRKVLEIIKAAGQQPLIVEYMKEPPSRATLVHLILNMDIPVADAVRMDSDIAGTLGLTEPGVKEEQLLDALAQHPTLLQRPIVISPKGIRICRPAEKVQELL